jgi:hypothetical protein
MAPGPSPGGRAPIHHGGEGRAGNLDLDRGIARAGGREETPAPVTSAAPGAQEEATRAAIEFARTTSPPPAPYTLGGGTATRTPVGHNILTALRKDKIIQDFGEVLLGQSHRLSGNIPLRSITDIDTAAHELGHLLQEALGGRGDLAAFTGEFGALRTRGRRSGPTVQGGMGRRS